MFRKARLLGGIAILMIIALLGLYATVLAPSEAPSSGSSPQPTPTSEAGNSMTLDDLLTQVGEELPGFGGFLLERVTNTPPYGYIVYVYMLDTTQREAVERAVKQTLGADQFAREILGVRVVQGDYYMVQLSQWYEHVRQINDPGLVLMDLDEGKNRLEVRVVDDAAVQRVEEKLKELPVPREAVNITIIYDSARDPVSPTEVDDPISDAELRDLETIARQKGISLQAAIDRYAWNDNFALVVAKIREAFPADFTEAAIVDAGHAWVAFAGPVPEAAREMIYAWDKSHSRVSVEVRSNLGFSELEKQRAIEAVHYAVVKAPEVRDAVTRFDFATGQITTTVVLEDTASDTVLDDLRAKATKALIDATRPDILNYIKIDVAYSTRPTLGDPE